MKTANEGELVTMPASVIAAARQLTSSRSAVLPNVTDDDIDSGDHDPDILSTADVAETRLAVLKLQGDHDYAVRCDGLAYSSAGNAIMVASYCGSATALKAITAILQSAAGGVQKQHLTMTGAETIPQWVRLNGFSGGYRIKRHQLRPNVYHVVAVAKSPRLLMNRSEAAIWCMLRSSHYTTPVLRHWVPWLRDQMVERSSGRWSKTIEPLTCFQLDSAMMWISQDDLDSLVAEGIRTKSLELRPAAESARPAARRSSRLA